MKIITERPFSRFEAWSGGKDTQDKIIEAGKDQLFESLIEDQYPEGITDIELNDLLWFESELVLNGWLGIAEEAEEEEADE